MNISREPVILLAPHCLLLLLFFFFAFYFVLGYS